MKWLWTEFIKMEKSFKKDLEEVAKYHKVWHQFSNWLEISYGSDYSNKLYGYDVITKVENYINRYCKQIKIIYCDDAVYASSIILLIPHPTHGITMIFIPQCSGNQNQLFLYGNHYDRLMEELGKMKKVYKDS